MATKTSSRTSAKALNAACQAARAGRTDEALSQLDPLAAAGSAAAAVPTAELAAFLDRWALVVPRARQLIEAPDAANTANVFDDMVGLLARSGHHGQPWADIAAAARSALDALEARAPAPALRHRHQTILNALLAYAERAGAPPHEVIRVFGVEDPAPALDKYHEAVAGTAALLRKKPREGAWRLFALAAVFRQDDDAVRVFEEHAEHMRFDNALDAARIVARRGDPERAWAFIEPRLADWYPVDRLQVAPVALITDPDLATMRTPERWRRVLDTPRGGA